ncbi:FAD-dependent protein [Bianquea renquensis]|uniref:FAD-dependent protein C-terminal domain-containing protein n=1 Tax=Bianquea renquensis TaxID=2763661 RepID=A0A926DTF5_9FIRM|nr:hypothetical protein [Bianquea renquensis]
MIRITQLKMPIAEETQGLETAICKRLDIQPTQMRSWKIYRRSLDARRGRELAYVYTVDVQVEKESKVWGAIRKKQGLERLVSEYLYHLPQPSKEQSKILSYRPVVVGFGPAGIFCSLVLARAGIPPIVVERGKPVEDRAKDVEVFWTERVLQPESNVQFGEGGAGTFSDGKLNTLVKDKNRRGRFVLEEMVKAGAPEEILYVNKPHVGTDRLRNMVRNLREEIISLGGDIRFQTRLTDFQTGEQGEIRKVLLESTSGEREWVETRALMLGIGHSARDTFALLEKCGVALEPKAFAMGLRIEHLQEAVNRAQYREHVGSPFLGAADYKLAYHTASGRGAYTFCMCPGGVVVASASEQEGVVTNGMSCYARDGVNANSALLVTVTPDDYQSYGAGPLCGVAFQRDLEHKAFLLGGGDWSAPVQRVGDYLEKRPSDGWGRVEPSFTGGRKPANLWEILPEFMARTLEEGIRAFDGMLTGFADPDAILTGVESRSSSPVRILREDRTLQSSVPGLYPMGEGAGYAGGIMSAAMDGIKAAEALLAGQIQR